MAEFRKAAQTDEFESYPVKGVNIEGWRIALVKLGDGYYALEDDCPHEHCLLSEGDLEGDGLLCPFHGTIINVKTGRVETGPAIVGTRVNTYQIQIEGNDILLVWS